MKYNIHPDFAKLRFPVLLSPGLMRLAAPVMAQMLRAVSVPETLKACRITVRGWQNKPVPVEIFRPKDVFEPLPCLIYFHGGAFCFKAAPYHKKLALRYAAEARCAVAFPDYHLLPKNPFPAAQQDALSVWQELKANACPLKLDSTRFAVGGDSAGAALAAAVCSFSSEKPCFQLLLYPVTDVKMNTSSMQQFTDTPLWNAVLNKKLWHFYLKNTPKEQWGAASPMQQPLAKPLPETYVETAQFDCLHDEGVAYAERLRRAGGRVTLYETVGTVHGYDLALNSAVTQESVRRRVLALNRAFYGDGPKPPLPQKSKKDGSV